MRALGTALHHLTSNLDEYRTTSEQDERGSQAVTFFSFPLGTVLYKARFKNALSVPENYPTVYIWYHSAV
jgi:hypothetical protein